MTKTVAANPKTLSDKEIIRQIVEEKKTLLFGELYDRYANKIYRKCISMVKNKEDARDLCHDVIVKAFLNIATFAGRSSFSTWVYMITYNQCIDFLRNKQKKRVVEFESEYDVIESDENTVIEEKKIFEIEVERLDELMHRLSETDRAILLMKYQDEMSIEEIEEALTLKNSAVKMRLMRARDRLRKIYLKTYGKRQ